MYDPRTLQDRPIDVSDSGQQKALLEARNAEHAHSLGEAELDLVIEEAASRLLGFALAREGEETYAETE